MLRESPCGLSVRTAVTCVCVWSLGSSENVSLGVSVHFSAIVNLHAFLGLRVSCPGRECLHQLPWAMVPLCASVCAFPWSSLVHPHHALCTAPRQNLGSWVGPGLELVDGCGKRGRPGRRPRHSSQKQKGQGSPSFHPSDLCVRCLPDHPREAARDAVSLPGEPQAEGPGASYLSAKRGLSGAL